MRLIAPAALIAALSLSACSDSPLSPVDTAANSAASRGTSTTQSTTATRIRVFAALTAPAGGAYPSAKGKASWDTRNANTKRELELEVEHLPVGLAVEFFMNGVKVGSATIGSLGEAELEFSTELGEPMPESVAGSTVEVRTAAGVVIVTGSFAT